MLQVVNILFRAQLFSYIRMNQSKKLSSFSSCVQRGLVLIYYLLFVLVAAVAVVIYFSFFLTLSCITQFFTIPLLHIIKLQ